MNKNEMNTISERLKKKFQGCILGAAIGDALGMPTENLSKEEIKELYGKVVDYVDPKNHFRGILRRGEYTDDTELTICLIKALDKGGINISKFVRNLIGWFKRNPKGIGSGTRKAIEKLMRGDFSGSNSKGVGGAIRVHPLGLLFFDNLRKLKEEVIKSTKITHNTRESISAALAVAFFVSKALLNRKDINLLNECYKFVRNVDEKFGCLILDIKRIQNFENAYNYFGTKKSYGVVPSAIATFLLSKSFEEGMIECVNAGGDTDSLASIYGAIAGAYWGINKMPKRWLKDLKNKEYLISLANYLYELKFGKI